jgi:hypothetical protein
MFTKKIETLVSSFPKISKNMGLTCGGLVLFQLCSNDDYSHKIKTIKEIRTELNISEIENIDIMQIMNFLINNKFNVKLIIEKNSFGKKGLTLDIQNIKKKDLQHKQRRYIQILELINTANLCEEIDKFSKAMIDEALIRNQVLVVVLNAEIFSCGEFKGQHLALLIGKDKNNYIFQGENIFRKNKNLVLEAINSTKIKSLIKVIKHD